MSPLSGLNDSHAHFSNCLFSGQPNPSSILSQFHINGPGLAYFDSGEFYFGGFNSGKFHGEGVMFFCKGAYLHGLFLKNKIQR